jgi:DNA sulfur modification protein DndD
MKLNKLTLENYACFLRTVELNFGNGLNIVNAGNGYGKSKFLDSINWVISNKIFQNDSWISANKVDIYPLWYTNSSNDGYNQDEIITTVILEFEAPDIDNNFEKDTLWTFTKKRYHYRHQDKSIKMNRDELEIKYIDLNSGQHVILGSHREDDVIETLFPSAIRNFMWFQGEAFREISLSHNSEAFNKILDTISHYPIYGKMVERVKQVVNKKERELIKLRRELQGLSTEQTDKINRKEFLLNKIPELEQQISDLILDIEDHEKKIEEYDDYLKKSMDYVKLDREIKSKEVEIKNINQSIEDYEISKVNLLIKKWVIAGSKKQIELFQSKIDLIQGELNLIDDTKIPLHIPGPEMVQEMIDDMKCHICERDIPSVNDQSYLSLIKRLNVYKEGQKAKWLRKNFDDFKRIKRISLEDYSEIEEGIKSHSKSIKNKISERNKLNREKENLLEELSKLTGSKTNREDGANYDLFYNRKKDKESSLRNLKLNLGSKEKNLQNYNEEVGKLSEEIGNFNLNNTEINQEERTLIHYKKLLQILEELEIDAKNLLEKEITDKSNYLFNIYYDNPGVILEIIKGRVKTFDKLTKDEIEISTLNKSQQDMIKFSVINSLLQISNQKLGNSLPLIADAPTSSSEWINTKYFTENVGSNFDQVVLFSKDYIEICKSDPSVKTNLINLCKKNNGFWYWCQKVDINGDNVGRQFDNVKADSESMTTISEKI